jgi:mannose-6-phosphate isomerase-like protein (cupin superfamily)
MINRGKVIRSGSLQPMNDGGQQLTFVFTADDTDGRFEWLESTVEFGGGPPYHLHNASDEVFGVLEGEVRFKIDNELFELGVGDTAFVPRGVPHSFTNPHPDRPAKMVGMHAPAALEAFLRVWAELSANGTPDEAAMAELSARYDMQLLGAPLAVELGLSKAQR